MKTRIRLLTRLGFILMSILSFFSYGFSYEDDFSYPPSGFFFSFEGNFTVPIMGEAFDHISTYWYDNHDIALNAGFSLFLGMSSSDKHGTVSLSYQRHVMTVLDLNEKIPFNAIKIGVDYYFTESRLQPYVSVYAGGFWVKVVELSLFSSSGYENQKGFVMDLVCGMRYWILKNLSVNVGLSFQFLLFKNLGSFSGMDQYLLIPSFGLAYVFKR